MNAARTMSTRPVPGGFAVFHNDKQVFTSPDLDEANAEARTLHDMNLAMHEMGQCMGTVTTAPPALYLWTEGRAA